MSNRFIFTKDVQGILVFLAARRRLSIRGEERVRSVGRFEQGNERAGEEGSYPKLPTVRERRCFVVSSAIALSVSARGIGFKFLRGAQENKCLLAVVQTHVDPSNTSSFNTTVAA